MARRRFAVALLVSAPVSTEIDGLRRALGDRQLDVVEPHVTIVPPINLRDDDIAGALAIVDEAACRTAPIAAELGPVDSFGPSSPVRFLRVTPPEPIAAFRASIWTGVLERDEDQVFWPHVTIDIDNGRTVGPDPALDVLRHYRRSVVFDRVTVLEHHHDDDGRRWEPYLSYRFT